MANADQLITDNLDLWSSAVKAKSSAGRGSSKKPEIYGIAKLRGIILDLAVSGLLVQQDPEEEDAYTLLQRIKTEKSELISRKTIKKEKNNLPIDLHEAKNSIPKQWALCRLSDIATVIRGITFPASEKSNTPENGRIACLRTSNIQKEITWEDLLYIRERFTKREDQIILKDDIIMSMANSRELVGKVAIVKKTPEDKITFGGFLAVIRPIILAPGYLMVFLRSTNTKNKLIKSASQTTNIANISLGKLNPLIVPIPPLAEQHRIVAKVDELMALCDQLEEEQENNLETHETLVSTLLNALTTAAADASQFADAWQRIQDNFDILFTTERSVDQLKQTILQLAVMGKLVPKLGTNTPRKSLGEILAERSFNGISKGPTEDQTATEVLRISAGTSSDDFYVDETDFKHVNISAEEIANATLKRGDLLACRYNGNLRFVGRFSLYAAKSGRIQVNPDKLIRFRVDTNFYDSRYVCFAMNAAQTRSLIEAMCSTTAGNIGLSAAKIKTVQIPIPPLPEQHQIVAKVDELMIICDQLKWSLAKAHATQLNLADSIVEQAIQSPV